jgi:hypothetical protein
MSLGSNHIRKSLIAPETIGVDDYSIEAKMRIEIQPNGIDLRTTLKTKDKLKIKVGTLSLSSGLINIVCFVFKGQEQKFYATTTFARTFIQVPGR